MAFRVLVAGILSLMLSMLTGCGPENEPSTQSTNETPSAVMVDPGLPPSDPITDEEAVDFAKTWERAVNQSDLKTLSSMFDFEELMDRAIQPVFALPKHREMFKKPNLDAGAGDRILSGFASLNTFSFLRITREEGRVFAVFRYTNETEDLYYMRIGIVKRDGRVYCNDLFDLSVGMDHVTLYREQAQLAIYPDAPNPRAAAAARKNRDRDLTAMRQFVDAAMNQKPEALELFDQMTVEGRHLQLVQFHRICIEEDITTNAFKLRVRDYLARFPDDPGLANYLFDFYAQLNLREETDRYVQILREWTGGDNYLYAHVANVASRAGHADLARDYYAKVDLENVEFDGTHSYLAAVTLELKDYKQTLFHLRELRDQFDWEFEDLRADPKFEGFVESAEYQEWLADGRNDGGN